jgi:hypothetical protein
MDGIKTVAKFFEGWEIGHADFCWENHLEMIEIGVIWDVPWMFHGCSMDVPWIPLLASMENLAMATW